MIELPETFDTYLIPGTNVLRNLIGATTVTELEAAENDLVSARMLEFQSNLPVAQGTLRQLQQIHRQLFQDIYDWAGQIRTVDIVKGSSQVFQPLAFFDVGVQYAERILDRDIKTARTQEAQNQTATVMNAMPLSGSLGAIRSALAGDPRFADPCGRRSTAARHAPTSLTKPRTSTHGKSPNNSRRNRACGISRNEARSCVNMLSCDCLTWLVCECMFYRSPSIGMLTSSCQWACPARVWKVPPRVSMMVR